MLTSDEAAGSLERCVDEVGERLATLGPHPNASIAFALRIHLGALLQVMLESGECTREELGGFLADLAEELLGNAEATGTRGDDA